MTYDLCIADRQSAGLKPYKDVTVEDRCGRWYERGEYCIPWGGVSFVMRYCDPILDYEIAKTRIEQQSWTDGDWNTYYEARSPKRNMVPAYKFSSNDPYHFHPDECRILAYHLHNVSDNGLQELGKFFAWASQHGGCIAR